MQSSQNFYDTSVIIDLYRGRKLLAHFFVFLFSNVIVVEQICWLYGLKLVQWKLGRLIYYLISAIALYIISAKNGVLGNLCKILLFQLIEYIVEYIISKVIKCVYSSLIQHEEKFSSCKTRPGPAGSCCSPATGTCARLRAARAWKSTACSGCWTDCWKIAVSPRGKRSRPCAACWTRVRACPSPSGGVACARGRRKDERNGRACFWARPFVVPRIRRGLTPWARPESPPSRPCRGAGPRAPPRCRRAAGRSPGWR